MMPAKLLTRTACYLAVIGVLSARTASAQTMTFDGSGIAESFEQLRVLVKPGSTVTLTDAAGTTLPGRLESLSTSILSLNVRGIPRAFRERDVLAVRQRRSDSLGNGAWWGFGVGIGLFAAAVARCDVCDMNSEGAYAAMAVGAGLYGAVGAGVGAGIDALIRGNQTVYRRPHIGVSVRF